MIINNRNIHEANDISLHDAYFESFVFDRAYNRLETVVKPEWPFAIQTDFNDNVSIEYTKLWRIRITCTDVSGTEISNCEYWGASPHIFSMSIISGGESLLVQRLFEDMKPEYKFCKLKSKNDYIEVLIEFSSGDKLRTACRSVQFSEIESDE